MRHAMLALVLLLPASALADTPTPRQPANRDDPNKLICRRESITGSLAQTRKVCMTRADWAARTRNAQEMGQQMQDAGRVSSCGSTNPGGC